MKLGKIFLVVLVVVIILLIISAIKLQIIRSFKFRNVDVLLELDKSYSFKPRVDSKYKVIISLTTIPDRLPHLYPAISSILDQSKRVDEIILNLPYVSRKGKPYILPNWFKGLVNVRVNWLTKDYGPSTKLLPLLKTELGSTRIIVFDDDNIYNSQTVEKLIKSFNNLNDINNERPRNAITQFGVLLDANGRIPGFSAWRRIKTVFQRQQEVDLLQGCFGFVVTPNMFPHFVFSTEKAPSSSISVDDVWFSGWLTINGIKIWNLPYAFIHIPIIDFGEVNNTVKLVNGENAGLVRDHQTIEWFKEEFAYTHVRNRSH